jgi:O-antigen/teichoic acid export membrane protein
MDPFGMKARAPLFARIAGREGVRQGSALLVATTAGSAALFLFHFLASRRLGVENYGLLASLLAFVALISFTANVGTSIVARFGAQYHATGELGKLRRLNDLVVKTSAIIVSVGCLIAILFSGQFATFFRAGDRWPLGLAVVLTAMGIVLALARGLQQGAQRFTALSVSERRRWARSPCLLVWASLAS